MRAIIRNREKSLLRFIYIIFLLFQLFVYNNNLMAQYEHPFMADIWDAYELSNQDLNAKILNILFAKLPMPRDLFERSGLSGELPEPKNNEEANIYLLTIESLFRQFFNNVKNGKSYCPVGRIKEMYGESPQDRIGVSSGGYFRLFVAYWTFNTKLKGYQSENNNKFGYANIYLIDTLLTFVNNTLAGAFFPSPGPYIVLESIRRKEIQKMLDEYSPNTTIKELFEGADPQKTGWPILK